MFNRAKQGFFSIDATKQNLVAKEITLPIRKIINESGLKKMSDISIIHGDALVKLERIPANSVDLIIADPPYNLGKDYGITKDNMQFDEYVNFSLNWLKESHRILKNTGTIYTASGHNLSFLNPPTLLF
ncbi:MAG: hypothetical protein BWK79_15370, partial [Beggiatoa sp. IS2]